MIKKSSGFITLTLSSLLLPNLALAAQSVEGYDCVPSVVIVIMNEAVTDNVTSVTFDSVSPNGSIGIDSTDNKIIEVTGITSTFACPPTSSVAVTIGSSTYTKSID